MNYLLLMYPDNSPHQPDGPAYDECVRICRDLVRDLDAKGQYLGAGILQPPTTAKSVRSNGSDLLITDGPFIETREHFAGYLLIRADSLDEALAIAARHPVSEMGTVEVRPIEDVSFLPTAAAVA